MPKIVVLYAVIKVEVEVLDDSTLPDAVQLLNSEVDYDIRIEANPIVKVTDTTLESILAERPNF